ncbi:hypothetical protein CHEID_00685 [Corynebacterium heidelbergense]|nr:hypothetical protein CHEID_00685 [Corynebacterium heidelbergense]
MATVVNRKKLTSVMIPGRRRASSSRSFVGALNLPGGAVSSGSSMVRGGLRSIRLG